MCGLCGVVAPRPGLLDDEPARSSLAAMVASLERRGPDDAGQWIDAARRVALGFRRLSILDVSPAGHQPMVSSSGRSVLVFNGEIYNFRELRAALAGRGVSFRSSGDAEVLLEALEAWGLGALERLVGMFALAWYDLEARRLTLARDPFGIKPLWLFEPPAGGLAFASQLDSLWHTPWATPGSVRPEVLRLYLEYSYLPAPHGPVEGTRQLEPGTWLQVDADGPRREGRFWSPPEPGSATITEADAALELLDERFEAAVARHRVADVPLGVFLSGGVDSPLVAAAARAQTGSPLDAFTLGNPGWGQDESAAAARHAEALDLRHHLLRLDGSRAELEEAIDDVQAAQHEPFADFSMLPTLLLSRFARRRITVALAGDGADEVFFGYERPRSLLRDGHLFRWPWPVRVALYALGRHSLGDRRLAPRRSDVIVHRDPGAYYRAVNRRFALADLRRVAPGLGRRSAAFELAQDGARSTRGAARRLAELSRRAEMAGQLQRCLKKVDMASMHYGLEVRVPFLDRELVEAAFTIDPLLHLRAEGRRGFGRKELLRRLLERRLGEPRREGRKLGFSIPLGDLLRGPLRRRVEETLFDAPLEPRGAFDRAGVEVFWSEHLRAEADHKWALWGLLSLQWWLRRVGSARRGIVAGAS
ncbi:MAG: asparagine synthase (glutamine-hydrolyzing) [Acidobacteriota bacterium]